MSIPEITVQQLHALRESNADILILDVRNPDEYALCNLGGQLIPLGDLAANMNKLNREQQIIVHCHAGGRSRSATAFLLEQGFKHVYNLHGGITAWAKEIDPNMLTY